MNEASLPIVIQIDDNGAGGGLRPLDPGRHEERDMPDSSKRKRHLVQARVSPAEYAAWTAKAASAGVSSSALLREAMTHTGVWTPTADDAAREHAREVERERTREIARLGNNLNQIARWANRHKSALEAVEVIVHLAAIERALRDLAPTGRPA